VLVTDPGSGRPRGWADAALLAGLPGGTPLGQVRTEAFGHAFTVGTDSLRAALDAAVLSPAGLAVGVDGSGRVIGVAGFDQLRAAIQADTAQPRQEEPGR
jgi:osmoprotectant transport system ATP-binding protein